VSISVGINVLIVDDSMLIRQVIKKVVTQVGIDVDQFLMAGDGQEALKILDEEPVGLVLSDINMPGMNGIEMLTRLRQMEDKQDLPVIMVSTEGGEERVSEAMELGASGYVLKPFTAEGLVAQLKCLGMMPEKHAKDQGEIDLSDPEAF